MLLVMMQPAAAQLVDRTHQHIVLTILDDEVCGVPVTTTVDIINNSQERLAHSGFPLFKDTGQGTITWTNPANGKSVSQFFAGVSDKDLTVVDNGDGTITLRTAITGVPEKITQANGKPLTMDVGRVVFVSVIDYNGTPTNADDDVLISQSVESISGPHPDLQSDFTLFCQVVVPALT
jgi:orotate phosphoribosyltransferase-like protein